MIRKVRVRVPASTSNLGPAFDGLGLALGLYDEVVVELHEGKGGPSLELSGEGAQTLPKGADNLMLKAANSLGARPERAVWRARSDVPLARGLGSSAAAAVAGIAAADALFELGCSREQIFEYAAVLEGHPDNAAPAVFGGLTLCVTTRSGAKAVRLEAAAGLRAVVCVPGFELETKKARAVLPATLLRDDAVFNVGRAALLVHALERGDWDLLSDAMEDRLHQPHRAALVPGLADVLRAAREAGRCGAALSGAGPSVVALCGPEADAGRIGAAMEKAFEKAGVAARSRELPVDREGVKVEVLSPA